MIAYEKLVRMANEQALPLWGRAVEVRDSRPAGSITVGRAPAVAERSIAGHQRQQISAVNPLSVEAIRAGLIARGKKPGRIVQLHGRYHLIEAEL